MKHDIKVGQQVFVLEPSYRSTSERRGEYKIVTKVGNKYFYIGEGYGTTKFDLETMREAKESNYPHVAYLTEDEYMEECARGKLVSEAHNLMCNYPKMEALSNTEILVLIGLLARKP